MPETGYEIGASRASPGFGTTSTGAAGMFEGQVSALVVARARLDRVADELASSRAGEWTGPASRALDEALEAMRARIDTASSCLGDAIAETARLAAAARAAAGAGAGGW